MSKPRSPASSKPEPGQNRLWGVDDIKEYLALFQSHRAAGVGHNEAMRRAVGSVNLRIRFEPFVVTPERLQAWEDAWAAPAARVSRREPPDA